MAHVLIIDDDEDVTRLLQAHLTEEGHTITVTHDGKEGMAQVLKGAPDLIMLDVFLPDATGYQMCNRIRMNESTKTTPIIMMTGAARFPNQQMYGRQRGANEYIFKPFDIVEVGDLVHKYIAPDPGNAKKKDPENDNMNALTAFLKRSMGSSNGTLSLPEVQEPVLEQPLADFGTVVLDTTPAPSPKVNGHPISMEAVALPQAPSASSEKFIAPSLGAKERFLDFSLEIFAVATRLCSTHAEKYLADQLLRTSLSVGAELHAASFAVSASEFSSLTAGALHHLRETGYWLMLTRKAGLLDKLAKSDLEKTCQSLTTLLTDYTLDKKSV